MSDDREQMKVHIAEILKGAELEECSAKKVREQVEQKMGLEVGALKSQKAVISAVIDEVLQENPPKDESGAEEAASASEEEEEKKPAKGKKRAAEAAPDDAPVNPKSTCKTKSGDEAPKNLKKIQESMKMTAAKFLRDGPTLKIDLCGNELQGPPRTFSSGNKGRVATRSNTCRRAPACAALPAPPPLPRALDVQVVHERQGRDSGGQHYGLGAGGRSTLKAAVSGVAGRAPTGAGAFGPCPSLRDALGRRHPAPPPSAQRPVPSTRPRRGGQPAQANDAGAARSTPAGTATGPPAPLTSLHPPIHTHIHPHPPTTRAQVGMNITIPGSAAWK